MKRRIKKWGDSLVIVFTKEDCEIYDIKLGDILDLSDMRIETRKKIKISRSHKKRSKK